MIRPAEPDAESAAELKRKADRLCALIVASDYPDVDIDIEIRNLRRWCERRLPDRIELFDLVYASRFRRLREQFRA
jgi:hypothetical protein